MMEIYSGGITLTSLIRTVGSIVLWVISCFLAFFNLVVLRDVWLLLADLLLPKVAVQRVVDKFLILITGIAVLGIMVYALESYSKAKTTARLWDNFFRLTAPQLWLLGLCHLTIALIVRITTFVDIMLPVVEITAGIALFRLRRVCVKQTQRLNY